MFKKILFAAIALLGISTVAVARDTYAHDASVLPEAARTTIANNFKAKVNLVKIDKDFGRVSEYDVILTDGTEITFDRNGNWDQIEVGVNGKIPTAFIPDAVAAYVRNNQPGQNIVGIDKERNGYEVELANGVEMKFDTQGRFVRYDH